MDTVRVLGVLEMPLQGLLIACVPPLHHEVAQRFVRAVKASARGAFAVLEFWRRERLSDVYWEGFHPSTWHEHLAGQDFAVVVLGRPTAPPGLARLADAVVVADDAGWHVLQARDGRGTDAVGLYGGSSGVGGSSGDGAAPAVGGPSGGSGSGSGGHR